MLTTSASANETSLHTAQTAAVAVPRKLLLEFQEYGGAANFGAACVSERNGDQM